jgi:hypothetical protein
MSTDLDDVLDTYLDVLAAAGSLTPQVLATDADEDALDRLDMLESVTIPDELRRYFARIDGYDIHACSELDLFEPQLAWGMFPLSIERAIDDYEDIADIGGDENPDYWPLGFVPILADGAGSWVLVNCIAGSPTYGGVYEMTDCVGCNRISSSLTEFFSAATREITSGLRTPDRDSFTTAHEEEDYFERLGEVYGDTPWFRVRGSEQIVDWR